MMNPLVQALLTGITSFAATNIDDLVISMIFFSQVNSSIRPQHIVVGKYLGFSLLILASLPGLFGGMMISKAWIGLLGIVPIAIGISHFFQKDEDESQVQTVSPKWEAQSSQFPFVSLLVSLLSPQSYHVAAVTVANGGDNIGIYLPLFASSSWVDLGIILLCFYVLVGVWCWIAYELTRHPAIAPLLTHYGHKIVPFVLIGLGIYILWESGTFQLLPLPPFN